MNYTEIQQFAKNTFGLNETQLLNAIVKYYITGELPKTAVRPVAIAVGLAYD